MAAGIAWNSHIRGTMRLDTMAMCKVQFADGDTLGGTVPLTLLQAVKPAQRRTASCRRWRRFAWIGLGLLPAAPNFPF